MKSPDGVNKWQCISNQVRKYMSIKLTGNENKVELLSICTNNGIVVDDKKPTNDLLIDLIKSHGDFEENPHDGIPKLSEVPIDVIPGEVVDDAGNVLIKTTSKLEDISNDNERMILVAVTDHDNNQTVEDDDENRLFQATWGNRICRPRQESVLVNGTPQYISRGMMKHMRTLKTPMSVTAAGENGGVKTVLRDRFTINELTGWTEEQLEDLRKTQSGRRIA